MHKLLQDLTHSVRNITFHLPRQKNGQNLGRCRNVTLKYDLLTLKMTSNDAENDIIELGVFKIPYIDTEIVSLALLEVTKKQDSEILP